MRLVIVSSSTNSVSRSTIPEYDFSRSTSNHNHDINKCIIKRTKHPRVADYMVIKGPKRPRVADYMVNKSTKRPRVSDYMVIKGPKRLRVADYMVIKSTKRPRVDYNTFNPYRPIVACAHPVFIKGECIWCGRKVDDDTEIISAYASAIRLDYMVKDMRFSKEEIAETKSVATTNLLRERKLFLVLDLDHTLLHSIPVQKLDSDEMHAFLDQADNSLKGDIFHLSLLNRVTKLRPYTRDFLEEANKNFKMYIYTRGNRCYANTIASVLDPKGVYFGSRVIAREDFTKAHQKGLDVVMAHERAVLILDDKKREWPDQKKNLIRIKKYKYFSSKIGENECDGTLAAALELLKKTHTKFFSEYDHANTTEADARKVLKLVRRGCEP